MTDRPRRSGLRAVPAAIGRGRDRLTGVFQHRYPTVAVTGMTGVGKTELVEHLSGRPRPGGVPDAGLGGDGAAGTSGPSAARLPVPGRAR